MAGVSTRRYSEVLAEMAEWRSSPRAAANAKITITQTADAPTFTSAR
jgi:hypothetical protein